MNENYKNTRQNYEMGSKHNVDRKEVQEKHMINLPTYLQSLQYSRHRDDLRIEHIM